LPIKIEKTNEKISSRMANILSWIAAALLGAASAVLLALLVWNGFLYLEYLRQPPLARPFSHGSFAPVGDDDDWTFKPQFAEERRPFPSVLLAPQQRAMAASKMSTFSRLL
jgi:hypothetical protein